MQSLAPAGPTSTDVMGAIPQHPDTELMTRLGPLRCHIRSGALTLARPQAFFLWSELSVRVSRKARQDHQVAIAQGGSSCKQESGTQNNIKNQPFEKTLFPNELA